MNWKSTAFVSGAGLLATWLASGPPPAGQPRQVVATTGAAAAEGSTADIETLARELAARTEVVAAFTRPLRNPFRFRAAPVNSAPAIAVDAPAVVPPIAQPSGPVFKLVGVALDRVDEQDVWTAILNTGGDVVLAKQGDEVGPGVRVTSVSAESVTLGRDDGTALVVPLSGQ